MSIFIIGTAVDLFVKTVAKPPLNPSLLVLRAFFNLTLSFSCVEHLTLCFTHIHIDLNEMIRSSKPHLFSVEALV